MSKIENFSVLVPAESLMTAELIVTMALILRGNYGSKKTYITFSGARNPKRAISIVSQACSELGIPFKQIPSDARLNYYLWSTKLDVVLAKQGMLPERLKWRTLLHIPESWIGHVDEQRLKILEDLTCCITKSKIVRGDQAFIIPDALNINKSFKALFLPIVPNIEVKYNSQLGRYCLYNLHYYNLDYAKEEISDDISDLL